MYVLSTQSKRVASMTDTRLESRDPHNRCCESRFVTEVAEQAAGQEVGILPVLSGVSIALLEVLEELGVLMPLL